MCVCVGRGEGEDSFCQALYKNLCVLAELLTYGSMRQIFHNWSGYWSKIEQRQLQMSWLQYSPRKCSHDLYAHPLVVSLCMRLYFFTLTAGPTILKLICFISISAQYDPARRGPYISISINRFILFFCLCRCVGKQPAPTPYRASCSYHQKLGLLYSHIFA